MTTADFTEDFAAFTLGVALESWADMSKEERIGVYQDKYTEFKWGGPDRQPPRMNPEFREKLIEALLSDKYKQGQHRLVTVEADGDHHCCLGVACDLVDHNSWEKPFRDHSVQYGDYTARNFNYKGFTAVGTLPRSVWEEIGLDETGTFAVWGELDSDGKQYTLDGMYMPGLESISLAQLNDSGFTFKQIVDVIRYFL